MNQGNSVKKGDTIFFGNPPSIIESASAVGKKEGEGPLGKKFDIVCKDGTLGEKSWEKAEAMLQENCLDFLFKKAKINPEQIDFIFSGDLQNQCTASSFTARKLPIQHIGLYGACSTMAQGLALSACFTASGLANISLAVTSSHFCTAERQFRTPLDYGGQRPPTAQWTVTGCGSALVSATGNGPYIKAVTFGRVKDYKITDISNMGAAMAPAAASTLLHYLKDTGNSVDDFDCIYTGDLGKIGTNLFKKILLLEGVKLEKHKDCGLLIYDIDTQKVDCGGSGCGCSASVLSGYILPKLETKKQKRILFMSTGALMSPTTTLQKESIPCIAHLVEISSDK